MFEGIVNLQLPFMLISSGVSSILYLAFLFFNMGHPKADEIAQQDDHQITIEESTESTSELSENYQFEDYFTDKDIENTNTLQVDSFNLRLTKTRHCKFKNTYSPHFAGASFSRPPPSLA